VRASTSRTLLLAVSSAFFILACSGAAPTPTAPAPTASGPAAPTPSPSSVTGAVTSAAQAAALVMASDPNFASLAPANPDLIGGCCSYEADDAPPGYQVTITIGWGDCPAGCINHHTWQFHVDLDGTISLVSQQGDEPPPVNPVGGQQPATVTVNMRAGPVCPVVAVPPKPGCEPRPVANASVVLRSPTGAELATATSNEQGEIGFQLPPGAYYIEPQPVEGLMGTAQPLAFSVVAGETLEINVDYDTGIR
jgi:hypothetical protein